MRRGNTQRIVVTTDARRRTWCDDPPMDAEARIVDLAERHSSDLDVVLLWARRSGRLWVVVTHRTTGRTASIAASAANALDVFHHPFAYAGAE